MVDLCEQPYPSMRAHLGRPTGLAAVPTVSRSRTQHEVPAYHNAESYMDAQLEAAGITAEKKPPLFRSVDEHLRLPENPRHRVEVLRMIKRRAKAAGLPLKVSCHTFRATGIMAYLGNGGTIDNAEAIAAYESPRTTKLYDRTSSETAPGEIERIPI